MMNADEAKRATDEINAMSEMQKAKKQLNKFVKPLSIRKLKMQYRMVIISFSTQMKNCMTKIFIK